MELKDMFYIEYGRSGIDDTLEGRLYFKNTFLIAVYGRSRREIDKHIAKSFLDLGFEIMEKTR